MKPEPQWLLYGVLILVALILMARFGKALLLLGGVFALGGLLWALGAQATATRQVATAATISATGQTANSVAVTVLATVLGFTLLIAGVICAYFWLRLRRVERQTSLGRWMPGPNAYWGRTETPPALPLEQTLNTLVQLELLRTLHTWRATGEPDTPAAWPALPAAREEAPYASDFWPEW